VLLLSFRCSWLARAGPDEERARAQGCADPARRVRLAVQPRIAREFAQETLGAAITRPRDIITVDNVIKAVASYFCGSRS
jgi:chromosomal replication initiation ATPase DnaA